MNRRMTTIAALALTAVLATACGGSDDGDEAAGEVVEIESTEDMAPATTAAAAATPTTAAAATPTTAAAGTPTTAAAAPVTVAGGITATISQVRSNQQLKFTIEASDPGIVGDVKRGIKRVCVVRYNEYGAAVNGNGNTCEGAPLQAVFGEYTKVWTQTIGCVNYSPKRIDVIVESVSGAIKKFKVASPPC